MDPLHWHTEKRVVKELIALSFNPRKITDEQRLKLVKSLGKFNLVDIPVVDLDNTLVSGHRRMEALIIMGRGHEEIDVRVPNRKLTEEELKEYNLLANTHNGEFDWEVLKTEFAGIDFDFTNITFPDAELPSTFIPEQAQEDDYEIPDEIETDIVRGDIIEFTNPDGVKHRLLCGDSTNSDDVAKLMAGRKADLIHTDPPYNVNYGGANNPAHGNRTILNDNLGAKEWEDFCRALFSNFMLFSKGGDIYMWGASGPDGMRMRLWLVEAGAHWSSTIIWKKDSLVLSPSNYQRMYEPAFYGWFKKSSFRADRKQVELWEIPRPKVSKEHPTMKPIELCATAITNSSKPSDLVLDFFLGSGSTMVAAHQIGRTCYGLELDPKYCQVIVNRLQKLDPTIKVTRNGQPL